MRMKYSNQGTYKSPTNIKDDGLIRPLSSSVRPRFYPCTGVHLPHPLSVRAHPAAAGALLMSVYSVHIHSCIVA